MQARTSIMLQAVRAIRRWKKWCRGERNAPGGAASPPTALAIDCFQSDLILVKRPKWWQKWYRKPTLSRPVITLVTDRMTGTVLHWDVSTPPNANDGGNAAGV
ncbi:hypothetical protein [Cupriavidus necator]